LTNLSHGLPSTGTRLHEMQPLLRSSDFEEPVYLDGRDGRIKFRKVPQLAKLPTTATLADVIEAYNRLLMSDADANLREP